MTRVKSKRDIEILYHNRFAGVYDYFQHGVKGDVNFYINYFKGFKGKILEVGAGTGRITIPLAKRGLDITAMDIAPKMLASLKEKACKEKCKIKVVCADMRRFHLKAKFDIVILTFRTFQHLYEVKDQIETLNNIKKYLKPGGILIFDVYTPSVKYMVMGNWKWQKDSNVKLPGVPGKVRIDFRNRYDMAKQMMYQEYRFTYPDGKKVVVPLRMRFFFRYEMEHLLKLTGFKALKLYGDFKKKKYRDGSPEMVWMVKAI